MDTAQAGFLLYGSYGYTGSLIARLAVERGLRPILAGRDGTRLRAQAEALRLEYCTFSLDDRAALEAALMRVPAVLHCAGPFSETAEPMVAGCLRTGRHYLDITGEIKVFEALAAQDAQAQAAGITLLPGVGFDVGPTDCLAAHLKARLPTATRLALAFQSVGSRFSRGTAHGAIQRAELGGAVRQDGQLVRVPLAWKERRVDFGSGPRTAVTIPWGDVSTAYYSTGIPNIEAYIALPAPARWGLALARFLRPLLAWAPVKRLLKGMVDRLPAGPNPHQRANGYALIWAEVQDEAGGRAAARMRTPEVYALTAETALLAAARVQAGEAPPGFQTPSTAFGPDFILEVEGVVRQDIA